MKFRNHKPLIRLLAVTLLLSTAVNAENYPAWQTPSAWPDRIISTLSEDPATSFSVTWRTHEAVTSTIAEVALATAAARFDLDAKTVNANTERHVFDKARESLRNKTETNRLDIEPVSYHSVTFTKLLPDTVYAFRVQGETGNWSPWRQLRTAPGSGPVEFLFFGDAQVGIRSHTTRVFDAARLAAPGARFMLHAGDLVNTGYNDMLWAEWYEAGGSMFSMIPSIPVPGNHDYIRSSSGEEKLVGQVELSSFWRPQFTLPVEASLPEALHEAVYETAYSDDLSLWAIDSTAGSFDEQMAWLGKRLGASKARWRVVYMHHPYSSWVGEGHEQPEQTRRRALFSAVLEQQDVDLVLTGHRHSYQRAESGDGVHNRDKTRPYPIDTVHIVTASTTKRGTTKVDGWERWAQEQKGNFSLTRWGDYAPLFGVIRVDGNTLHYRALDSLGQTYDEFIITKTDRDSKMLSNGEATFGPIWNIETAGPYEPPFVVN